MLRNPDTSPSVDVFRLQHRNISQGAVDSWIDHVVNFDVSTIEIQAENAFEALNAPNLEIYGPDWNTPAAVKAVEFVDEIMTRAESNFESRTSEIEIVRSTTDDNIYP